MWTPRAADGISGRGQGGFTVVELSAAILILGILGGLLAVETGVAMRLWRLDAAAWELAASLRLARLQAIRDDSAYRVLVRVGEGVYQPQRRTAGGYQDDGPPRRLADGIVVAACSHPASAIGFRSRGLAAELGTITLAGPDAARRKVVVSFTGEVRVE